MKIKLNKIANGEEVPKKIKVFNHIFKRELDADDVWYYLDGSLPLLSLINSTAVLNAEVEIIEEDEENEDINIQRINQLDNIIDYEEINAVRIIDENRNKINELIKAVKQLDKQIKEK